MSSHSAKLLVKLLATLALLPAHHLIKIPHTFTLIRLWFTLAPAQKTTDNSSKQQKISNFTEYFKMEYYPWNNTAIGSLLNVVANLTVAANWPTSSLSNPLTITVVFFSTCRQYILMPILENYSVSN